MKLSERDLRALIEKMGKRIDDLEAELATEKQAVEFAKTCMKKDQAENERLREQYTHIKAWINQPVGLLTIEQLTNAVTRMCDDALKEGGQ